MDVDPALYAHAVSVSQPSTKFCPAAVLTYCRMNALLLHGHTRGGACRGDPAPGHLHL
jgi:hypothetical protein